MSTQLKRQTVDTQPNRAIYRYMETAVSPGLSVTPDKANYHTVFDVAHGALFSI